MLGLLIYFPRMSGAPAPSVHTPVTPHFVVHLGPKQLAVTSVQARLCLGSLLSCWPVCLSSHQAHTVLIAVAAK